MPMLGFSKSSYTEYFINCHILNEEEPKLVIIFDNIEDIDLNLQIYKLKKYYTFEKISTINDEIVVILKIPDVYIKDYNKFLQGKYSTFSEDYKKTLMKIHGSKGLSGVNEKGLPLVSIYDVINPSKDKIRELENILGVKKGIIKEIYDIPNLDLEYYKSIKELKKIYGDN